MPYVYTFDVTEQQTEKDVKYPPNAWPTHFYINAYRANHVPLLYKADLAIREQLNKGESLLLNILN